MGILSGKDLLSSKYITAEISDDDDTLHHIAIKNTYGDYFIAEINNKLFAFTLRNARILISRKFGAKSFKVIQYDTSNFASIKPETKELEHMLIENELPKMNMMLYNILRTFARKEGKDFKKHTVTDLLNDLKEHEKKYPEEVENIRIFLQGLKLKEITTPLRKVTDFIEDDLIATSPSFLAELMPRFQRLDYAKKKISNVPTGPKFAYTKLLMIGLIVALIAVVLYYGYEEGWFKTFTDLGKSFEDVKFSIPAPSIPQTGGGGTIKDDAWYQARYTPSELKAAVDSGEIAMDDLPPNTKNMLVNLP